MKLSFSERDEALGIALSIKDRLQSALSSSKHGVSGAYGKTAAVDVRTLLRGNNMNVTTVAIDYNTSKSLVLYKWYSLCTVLLREVLLNMDKANELYIIHLDPDKMSLYSLEPVDAATCLGEGIKSAHGISVYGYTLTAQTIPSDILSHQVRKTRLNCRESDWDVTADSDTVYTIFKGERFDSIVGHADEVLSTNVEITVSRLGRVRSLMLYRKHIHGGTVDPYLANIFCSNSDKCNVYNTISEDSPVKRVSIKDQVGTLVTSSLEHRLDRLITPEARFMVGANVDL